MSGYKNEIQQLCTGEPDFAFEPLVGLRQWSIESGDDALGLRGHYNTTWMPGENVASCKAAQPSVRATKLYSFYSQASATDLVAPVNEVMRQAVSDAHVKVQEDSEFLLDLNEAQVEIQINNITVAKWIPLAELRSFIFDPSLVTAALLDDLAYALQVVEDVTPATNLDRRPFSYFSDFHSRMWSAEMRENGPLPVSQLRVTVGVESRRRRHAPAYPACTCGFYAYTDVESLHKNSTTYTFSVFGLIQGYGTVTLGTKGFRAEKAQIIAITVPQTTENDFVDTPWMTSANTGLMMAQLSGIHRWRNSDEPRRFIPAYSSFNSGYGALKNLARDMHVVEDIAALVAHAQAAYGVDLA